MISGNFLSTTNLDYQIGKEESRRVVLQALV
jgi:hypothetical protein